MGQALHQPKADIDKLDQLYKRGVALLLATHAKKSRFYGEYAK